MDIKTIIIYLIFVFILFMFSSVVSENIKLNVIEIRIGNYFNDWKDNPYVRGEHDCSDMSIEVEKYFETQLGYDCYIVYGRDKINKSIGHMWNIVDINNHYYEFESTGLFFDSISKDCIIDDIQTGYYINNQKCEKTIGVDLLWNLK